MAHKSGQCLRFGHKPKTSNVQNGFTLAELAIVLVIVALLISGMLVPLAAQRDVQNLNETERQLSEIREALLGFAASHGRLPCPAAPPPAGGTESPVGTGACTNAANGFVPAATLGLGPTDPQGYMVDPWGNPIHYSVYSNTISALTNPFTTAGRMKIIGIEALALSSAGPPPVQRKLLYVCNSSIGVTANDCGTAQTLSDSAVAVIFSIGRATTGGAGSDEAENLDNDSVFISHAPTATGAAGGEFDDVSVWLSPYVLYNRLISAGRLP